jgi:hypothetical protein
VRQYQHCLAAAAIAVSQTLLLARYSILHKTPLNTASLHCQQLLQLRLTGM